MPNANISIAREVAALRRSLRAMDRSLRRLAPKLRTAKNGIKGSRPARVRRKLTLSPKRRAELKLQGKYMALIRHLPQRKKAEVRGVREKKGMPAAIARARKMMNL